MKGRKSYLNILICIVLSSMLFILFSCNKSQKIETKESDQRKPYLLYFNERDTMIYKIRGGLFGLKHGQDTLRVVPYYLKGKANMIFDKGVYYRIGPDHEYIQRIEKSNHTRKYIPKESIEKNYEVVKIPWKGYDIDILDLSNPDSAFVVKVDAMNRVY
ncbi:MAG: hypothetical protein ACR2MS_06745 [Weeksellaceae bacterium]